MQMSRVQRAADLALLVVLLATGCADTSLSRAKAAELITAHEDTRKERTVFLILATGLYLGGQEGKVYKAFEKAGYLVTNGGTTDLTQKGRSAAAANKWKLGSCGFQPRCVYVPVARRSLREVTGIAPGEKAATAEFLWNWELTELGREVASTGFTFADLHPVYDPFDPDKAVKGSAAFTLYDDGWRVREIRW